MIQAWIAVRIDLPTDPRVARMVRALNRSLANVPTEYRTDVVVARLQRVWGWFTLNTDSGHAEGIDGPWLDGFVNLDGFAAAMQAVGWLATTPTGIEQPDFDRWNVGSLKERAREAAKKRRQRNRTNPELPDKRGDKTGDRNRDKRGDMGGDILGTVPLHRTEQDRTEEFSSPPSPSSEQPRGRPPDPGGELEPAARHAVCAALRAAGCNADVAARASALPRVTRAVAYELAAEISGKSPKNPTGFVVAGLRQRGIVPQGWPGK